jgi:molecular chaperone GrpE
MGEKVTIPVKVIQPARYPATPPVAGSGRQQANYHEPDESRPVVTKRVEEKPVPARAEPVGDVVDVVVASQGVEGAPAVALGTESGLEEERDRAAHLQEELDGWRDQALRLQAEMDNYRKRQQRWAQDQIEAERQKLLGAFLPVVDNLERALAAPAGDGEGLRQGIHLTYRTALQLLQKEGVEQVQAEGRPFDPHWHEAVATVGLDGRHVAPNTVVRVMEPGYCLGDRLLRPARVVVAV